MRCNPVVIIGVPLAIIKDKNHFHNKKIDVKAQSKSKGREKLIKYGNDWTTRYYLSQKKHIALIATMMIRDGIRVFNATECGILDVIPKISYRDALHITSPKFKPSTLQARAHMEKIAPHPIVRNPGLLINRRKRRPKRANQRLSGDPFQTNVVRDVPLKPSDVAIMTIVSDLFLPGYLCLIKSILKYNSGFANRINILSSETKCRLSDASKKKIRQFYDNVKFHALDEHPYSKIKNAGISYFALEAFRVGGFKKVLLLDSDMLCLGDISYLITKDTDFGVAADTPKFHKKETVKPGGGDPIQFDDGVMSIGQSYMSKKTFGDIISIAAKGNGMAEKASLNQFFRDRPVFYFDSRYNALKTGFQHEKNTRFLKGVRLLHFVGRKPWISPKKWKQHDPLKLPPEHGYKHLEALWKHHYEE